MNRIGNRAEGIIAYHGTDKTGFSANGWSLNPGRYVGVVETVDTTTPEQFRAEMKSMHDEFAALTAKAHEIEKRIAANLSEVLG